MIKPIEQVVEQLRLCEYECEAGCLENNLFFQELEKMQHFTFLPDDCLSALIYLIEHGKPPPAAHHEDRMRFSNAKQLLKRWLEYEVVE